MQDMSTALQGTLIGPAPHSGVQWFIRLAVPHNGLEHAVMNDETEGIGKLRERLGGILTIGAMVLIMRFEVCDEALRVIEVA